MKKYREYKATLERRYPPCCKECWPKVSKQIRRSRYGARTDHLRHSIEQAQRNRALTRRTWLDLFNGVGASLFFGGLVLQLVWHASVLLPATMTELGQDGRSSLGGTLPRLETVVKLLPASATLISWSILSSLLSCWWNPFWAQTVRGFTRHLRGFQSWYSYQALIVLGRILSWQLSSFVSEYAKILGCHAIISVVTLVVSSQGALRTTIAC